MCGSGQHGTYGLKKQWTIIIGWFVCVSKFFRHYSSFVLTFILLWLVIKQNELDS